MVIGKGISVNRIKHLADTEVTFDYFETGIDAISSNTEAQDGTCVGVGSCPPHCSLSHHKLMA